MRTALPDYLRSADLSLAPPGHRFGLYFKGWGASKWELAEDNLEKKEGKRFALENVVRMTEEHQRLLDGLRYRQIRLALASPDVTLIEAGLSEAPFVTGMGMEHPLENGFAFLSPYGVPYLPASSVKGVLRRAAEELALFDAQDSEWSVLRVWWLFGFDENSAHFPKKDEDRNPAPDVIVEERRRWREAYAEAIEREDLDEVSQFIRACVPSKQQEESIRNKRTFLDALVTDRSLRRSMHLRGSICFWDVFPQPANNSLRIDIMNPHYTDYYQKGQPPGDWGDPNPIFFLAMPPGTHFRFIIRLEPVGSLPSTLREKWKPLMSKALDHAFSWLGFGAKTSLGYGLMRHDKEDPQRCEELLERERKDQEAARRKAEEFARQQQYEKLSAFDKLLFHLEQREAPEQEVNEAYLKLENHTAEEQQRLAKALVQAYRRLNKWSGSLSEKQKKKVTRLKQILGEK